jgi:bifunctional UDP-N-acetylglucosamine pyrophosphorylase/glucosamine-1-phosphate N-acetyltransferase
MSAAPALTGFRGDLLVIVGDAPFLTGRILKDLLRKHRDTGAAATLMTAVIDPPPPYGRIVRNEQGEIRKIVEDRDASPAEKKITELNTSHYCFRAEKALPLLYRLGTNNDQGEYYLPDVIQLLVERGERVETRLSKNPDVLMGINSREDLSRANRLLLEKITRDWMAKGVTIVNPGQVYIEPDVKIGKDTVLCPFTSLLGNTRIGEGCRIGPQVKLENARVGNGCRVEFAMIENRIIGDNQTLGPFVYMKKE